MTNGVSSPAATMLLLLHLLVAACCWVGAVPLQQRRSLQMMTGESGRDCFDGLDNDEDGLTDCEDPDCQRDRRIAQRCRKMTTRNEGPGTAGSRFGGKGGKTVKLNNGMDFPLASFGLQIYSNSQATALTKVALAAGFRNFFSSVLANNQKGFSAGVAASSVPRKQIFVCGSVDTQSCSGFDQCKKQTAAGCAANTRDLGPTVGALDMIMLDYPAGSCPGIKGQWAAFEEMLSKGRVKSLAVSNFDPSQLDCLLSVPGATVPAVNQLRFNVDESIKAIADNAKRGNILVQGWSPLQSGLLVHDAQLQKIGRKYGKSSAQVALKWIVQHKASFTTSANTRAEFDEDLDLFNWALTANEMAILDQRACKLDPDLCVSSSGH